MKKTYIIILLIILVVFCFIFIFVKCIEKQEKREELEAIKIFEENAVIQAFINNSIDNTNDIQNKLEDIKYVKNVEFVSKEDALEDMKNAFSDNFVDEINDSNNIVQDSFIITLEVNNIEDLKEIKTLESDIKKIQGIDDATSCGINEPIEVYEKTGTKGLREYFKISTIMSEHGVNEVKIYLDENEETRKTLQDFIKDSYILEF